MNGAKPFYISPNGGVIFCFRGDSGRVFRSCFHSRCIYATDLHTAKSYLNNLESNMSHRDKTPFVHPEQRKTTLKWNSNGELSSIDMARILDCLRNPELTECTLSSEVVDYGWNQTKAFNSKLLTSNS
ncbi:hypothetical protein [Prochlorococcus sp. MIT 1341]|uniref:hypothetical protein n=1 Tax=Prochlorococcus sp. MIT 1341 TaxID=3096221 RepID=UPI0039BF9455